MELPRRETAVRDLLALATTRRRRAAPRDLGALAGFGAGLRRLRCRAGLTQRELARAAGMTRPMISAFEHEKTLPSLGTLARILGALGVSLAALAREIDAGERLSHEP